MTGGRDYQDKEFAFHVFDRWRDERGIECIIEGGASGADALAGLWAKENGITLHTVPAEWTLGKRAGMLRNLKMLVDYNPDVVIAFPGGNGTANMIALAYKHNVPVIHPVEAKRPS